MIGTIQKVFFQRRFGTFPAVLMVASVLAGYWFGITCKPSLAERGAEKRLVASKKSENIRWYRGNKSYSEGLKAAKESNKPVLVDVYTDWCGWCKKLDADVYENPKASEYIGKTFVCVKSDAEKGEGIEVAKKFGVNGFPCTLILDASGTEKGRISGYKNADEFPRELQRIVGQ